MVKHAVAPEWTYEETKQKLLGMRFGIMKDFAIIGYVLGARLNEIRRLKPKNISLKAMADGTIRIISQTPTEKNPHIDYADVPMNPKNEPWYARHILEWQETFDEDLDTMPFQQHSPRYYQRHLKDLLDIHPHALRHLRVHHVDDGEIPGMKALTPGQFKDFFRWHKIETSAHYQSRRRSRDLAEKM